MLRTWTAAIVVVLLLLTGCSDNKVSGTQKKEKQVTKVEQKQEQHKTTYPYSFPLTGKGSNTETDGRAVAVMVNNHPKARPQSGLTKADIVYEILAEGDITRFLAVFQSEKPETIGPVRSARKYYMEIAKGLHALFVNHGTSLEAENMIKAGYIDDLDGMVYDGTLFKRAAFRQAPHNSYITYKNILKGVALKHYTMDATPPAFQFMTGEQAKNIAGNMANKVSITYSPSHISDSSFEYDPSIGRYKRYSGGQQTVDYDTKEPVLIDNVFIIEANHQIVDSVGHRSIDLLSGGKAYLLQRGKINEVEWAFRNDRIVPMKNGEEIPFVKGHTWVNVVPSNPGLNKAVSFKQ